MVDMGMSEYIENLVREYIEDAIFKRKKIPEQNDILQQYDLPRDQLKKMTNIYKVMDSLWGLSDASIEVFHEKISQEMSAPKNFELIKYITAQVELALRVEQLRELDDSNEGE